MRNKKNVDEILEFLKRCNIKEEEIENTDKKLHISDVIGSSIPKPPEPPLCRVLREGVGHFCANCGSTSSKSEFLGLFGERLCDNQKCPNSKSKKNYQ